MLSYNYIFILGRYPDLSKNEIFSTLRLKETKTTTVFESESVLVLESTQAIDLIKLNKQLGGTVKVGHVIASFPQSTPTQVVSDYLTSDVLFVDYFSDVSQKINFGISLYPYARHTVLTNLWARALPHITRTLKDHLEAQGFKVRYPHLDGTQISSASVEKNKLLTLGAEILMIETPTELLIGKTAAVQEFESFSQRDYGRPARDMESGIMPPKIARMMLNLAEVPTTATIIDPFCGSGTLLQEALLLGFKDIIGTDLSPKAIKGTKKNITWIQEHSGITATPKIFLHDVTTLSDKIPEHSIDAIITEPYMGPNLQHKTQLKVIQQTKAELEDLYLGAYKEFSRILKPGGVVVMILPIFHIHTHYLSMDILDKIQSLGFSQAVLTHSKRNSVTLGNTRDFVLREIVKFKLINKEI